MFTLKRWEPDAATRCQPVCFKLQNWWAALCTFALFVFVKPIPWWPLLRSSQVAAWTSEAPKGPTHTSPHPHPLLFVLPSFLWECNWLCVCMYVCECVWVSQPLFVCVEWLFHCNGRPGTKTSLEEIQAHVSGLILTLSLPHFILSLSHNLSDLRHEIDQAQVQRPGTSLFLCWRNEKESRKQKSWKPKIFCTKDWLGLFWVILCLCIKNING